MDHLTTKLDPQRLSHHSSRHSQHDGESKEQAEEKERALIEESKKGGAAAFQFDPNASAEEKAAMAKARVPDGFHHEKKPTALGIVSDVGDGSGPDFDLPSPSKEGAMAAPADTAKAANGHVSEDMRWARDRVGWEPRFGNGDPEDDEGPSLLDHQTLLEGKLDDKWFGDWYYNAGVIMFACFATYLTTLLGGGLASLFIIMAVCSTYYRTSIRRVRRNFRDDITREMAKQRLETDTESLEWINSFLVKFWPIYAPVLCETIINSVDQVLSTTTPAFLESLRMKTFVLGTKPPRLEHVKTYPKAEDDTVLMDWKFSFNPNDTADMTERQLKNKVNPKVVLEIRVGKGVISKGLDVIVEDFAFSGLMRVKVKLQIPFPHIEKAEICFLDRPEIDYVCKPLGGDSFGFDINFVPGLEGFIQEQIHANLAPIMYDPNVFPIEIAKMLAGNAVDQAIGVLQVTIHSGAGLRNPDKYPGIPDGYVQLSINNREVVGQTKTIMENAHPQWNETFNIIVTSLKDSLSLGVFDYNEFRKDKELGIATWALEALENDPVHENAHLEIMSGGKARGTLLADVRFFKVLEGEKLADGTVGPAPESNTGIAKFTVEQAKELDGSKSLIGQLSPYAILLLNGKEIHRSQTLKRTNNPIWPNATKELLITDRKTAKLGLVIKDERTGGDATLGTYQVRLNDMIDLMSKGQEWYHLAQTTTGRTKMMLEWKPVALKGAAGGGGYVKPIGVMRIHFQNARELRNVETMGKSDPYGRVLLSGIEKGRTVTWFNNLNPDWDEIVYVPVHSTREKLTLEVMDQESFGSDRSLGLLELSTADYITQSENGEYLAHDEKTPQARGLTMGGKGSSRGTLNFTAAFYPVYNVADPEEEEEEKEAAGAATNGDARKSLDASADKDNEGRNERSGTITSLKPAPSTHSAASSGANMVKMLADGEKDQAETEEVKPVEAPKIKLTVDDLQSYESGLMVFKIKQVDVARSGCRVEVVMDDHLFPSYRSSKIRSKNATLNETADAMVRELEFSQVTVRLVEKADEKGEGEDSTIAKMSGSTLQVLKEGLYKDYHVVMRDDEGRENHVVFELKYLPVKMRLEPSESINNMGKLRVDVLDAADLPAADRNGYSDPYCKFRLDGKKVFQTQTQKKTLHPAWNEFFEVPVRSRTGANFKVEVYDWDRGDKDDLLGIADVNLAILEPFESQEVTLGLDGKSGAIRLKMLFRPDYVTRSRQGSSTFSGTFATPGKVVGAPVKGVGKGAVFVGGNVVRGASFISRGFRRRKSGSSGGDKTVPVEASADAPPVPPVPSVPNVVESSRPPSSTPRYVVNGEEPPTTPHKRNTSDGDSLLSTTPARSDTAGTATLTVVKAEGYSGSHIRVFVKQVTGKGAREVHKTKATKSAGEGSEAVVNYGDTAETFTLKNVPHDASFNIDVKDAHTFGSDDDLGEGTLSLSSATGSGLAANEGSTPAAGLDQRVPCGSGVVTVRVAFVANSIETPASAKRRTFLGGLSGGSTTRLSRDERRSVTPGVVDGTPKS